MCDLEHISCHFDRTPRIEKSQLIISIPAFGISPLRNICDVSAVEMTRSERRHLSFRLDPPSGGGMEKSQTVNLSSCVWDLSASCCTRLALRSR